jgi:hypothetical protein
MYFQSCQFMEYFFRQIEKFAFQVKPRGNRGVNRKINDNIHLFLESQKNLFFM